MSEFVVFAALTWLLPLALVVTLLVLLKRIADGIDRLDRTLDRELFHIGQALTPDDDAEMGRTREV
jgi:hypothetical protein